MGGGGPAPTPPPGPRGGGAATPRGGARGGGGGGGARLHAEVSQAAGRQQELAVMRTRLDVCRCGGQSQALHCRGAARRH